LAWRGLVRVLLAFDSKKGEATTRAWAQGGVGKEYRRILIAAAVEQREEGKEGVSGSQAKEGSRKKPVKTRRGLKKEEVEKELARLREAEARDLQIAKAICCRVGCRDTMVQCPLAMLWCGEVANSWEILSPRSGNGLGPKKPPEPAVCR
jgi:hypothetical protein